MLSNLGVVLVLFFLLWIASVILRDASIADCFWGIAFLIIASATSSATEGFETRARLVVVLTAIWGLRLSFHIMMRNLGAPEDHRYRRMRKRWGADFPLASLPAVFGLQAVIAWVVSLPLQAAISAVFPNHLTPLDVLAIIVWTAGFLFEAVADLQLARFKSNPANTGTVMTHGLWRYTRHPNYFGDAVVWWGLWLFAAATGAWWTAIGPALMTFLLLRVSGVKMLEEHLRRTKPGFEAYRRRTSSFLPLPPRSN